VSAEIVTEVMFLPDGMEPGDVNEHTFAVLVRWRGAPGETGRGGYAVTHSGRHLSKRGNWRYNPEPYLQRHYRWRYLGEAIEQARAVVNTIKVNGSTWAEWQARRAQSGET
jgi:hypothetical protein